MTRWLLALTFMVAVTGWAWLAHGVLWAVPPGPVRVASLPWPCAEPLAFNRTLADDADVAFIDLQTPRQLARGIGNGAVDVALVDLDDLRGDAFSRTPTRLLGVVQCGDSVRAAVGLAGTAARTDGLFAAAWDRGLAASAARPAEWEEHLRRRRLAAPVDRPRFVPATDRAAIAAAVSTTGGDAASIDAVIGRGGAP